MDKTPKEFLQQIAAAVAPTEDENSDPNYDWDRHDAISTIYSVRAILWEAGIDIPAVE